MEAISATGLVVQLLRGPSKPARNEKVSEQNVAVTHYVPSGKPAFKGMHVAPEKAKCDRWTDNGQIDPNAALCHAAATKSI